MKSIIPTGEFRETGTIQNDTTTTTSIFENKTILSTKTKEKIINHLENNGMLISVCFSGVDDMFDNNIKSYDDPKLQTALNIYSDGYWMWMNCYSYFIKKYDIFIEENFINHIINFHQKSHFSQDEIRSRAIKSNILPNEP